MPETKKLFKKEGIEEDNRKIEVKVVETKVIPATISGNDVNILSKTYLGDNYVKADKKTCSFIQAILRVYGYNDIRPDNVKKNKSKDEYVIIDWLDNTLSVSKVLFSGTSCSSTGSSECEPPPPPPRPSRAGGGRNKSQKKKKIKKKTKKKK